MNNLKELQEGVEKSASFAIIEKVRQSFVDRLPEGKGIDDASDEEFERAYWKLMDDMDLEPEAERPEKFKPSVEEADT